jgi:hypothetical protein
MATIDTTERLRQLKNELNEIKIKNISDKQFISHQKA